MQFLFHTFLTQCAFNQTNQTQASVEHVILMPQQAFQQQIFICNN
jgi:hypothetical protein